MFPASRGLSRRGKLKREERDLCRLPTSFLSRMPSRFLNNQVTFLSRVTQPREPVWIWARARAAVEFERPLKFEMDQSKLNMKRPCERPLSWTPLTSLSGKPKRRILRQIFRSLRVFRLAKHTYLEGNLLGFMELLVLLWFGTFLFEEKATCWVTSGQRWMEWFPC